MSATGVYSREQNVYTPWPAWRRVSCSNWESSCRLYRCWLALVHLSVLCRISAFVDDKQTRNAFGGVSEFASVCSVVGETNVVGRGDSRESTRLKGVIPVVWCTLVLYAYVNGWKLVPIALMLGNIMTQTCISGFVIAFCLIACLKVVRSDGEVLPPGSVHKVLKIYSGAVGRCLWEEQRESSIVRPNGRRRPTRPVVQWFLMTGSPV